ncbi:hypothetical protein ACFL3S_00370 [Gemmatimonadota bacterium]
MDPAPVYQCLLRDGQGWDGTQDRGAVDGKDTEDPDGGQAICLWKGVNLRTTTRVLVHLMFCVGSCAGCDSPVAQEEDSASDEATSVTAFFGETYGTCHTETSYTIWGNTSNHSHTDKLVIHQPWGDWVGVSDLVFQIELGPWPVFLGVKVKGSSWATNLTEASSAYTRTYVGSGSLTPTFISGEFRVEAIPGTTEEKSTYEVTFSAYK